MLSALNTFVIPAINFISLPGYHVASDFNDNGMRITNVCVINENSSKLC